MAPNAADQGRPGGRKTQGSPDSPSVSRWVRPNGGGAATTWHSYCDQTDQASEKPAHRSQPARQSLSIQGSGEENSGRISFRLRSTGILGTDLRSLGGPDHIDSPGVYFKPISRLLQNPNTRLANPKTRHRLRCPRCLLLSLRGRLQQCFQLITDISGRFGLTPSTRGVLERSVALRSPSPCASGIVRRQ